MKFKKGLKKAVALMAAVTMAIPNPLFTYGATSSGSVKNIVEKLDRGISAINTGTGMLVSWRYLANDSDAAVFKLYRNGSLVYTSNAGESTCYLDASGKATDKYTVETIENGRVVSSAACKIESNTDYLQINLTPPTGSGCTYSPNDCSVGDADGDGEYEIFLKWDPSNSKDNSQAGVTGNVYIDCIKLDGTRLWRIDLGPNIRAGAHYTQFLVADFDCDGYAEMTCKTADGTVDGTGKVIGTAGKSYANSDGYILSGNEYYTLFDGRTGKALDSVNYNPARGTVSSWGDKYGNRVDRFLGTVAYLDGEHPSAVTMRGYYTRMTACAYDVVNKKLVERWFFDTGNSTSTPGYGDGNHNVMVADVDNDGKQEIITGTTCIDDNGKLKWNLNMGHGDAMHLGDLLPDRDGLELWICHEDAPYGVTLIDATKGTKIFHVDGEKDTGRCCADNVWAGNPGAEFWGLGNTVYNGSGTALAVSRPAINFLSYWDGDLEREILDGYTDSPAKISKMTSAGKITTLLETTGYYTCNTTKGTPCLSADIFGDWREELIVRAADSKSIRIYATTYDTDYRITTLMHDPQYRNQVSAQQTAYNQPPHTSFYLGSDKPLPARPNVTVLGASSTGSTGGESTGGLGETVIGEAKIYTFGCGESFFTATGSAKAVTATTVEGKSISNALKIDSSGKLEFTLTGSADIVVYAASKDTTGVLNVGGNAFNTTQSVSKYTATLGAGSYIINKKTGENYIYYVSVTPKTSGGSTGGAQAHTHEYSGKVTKAATCIAEGVTTYTCACGDTYTATIAKTTHNYANTYTVDVEATATTAGSKSRHCTTVGCSAVTDRTTIPAKGFPAENVTVSFVATALTGTNSAVLPDTYYGRGFIKVVGEIVSKNAKDSTGNYTNNVTSVEVQSGAAEGFAIHVDSAATLAVTACSSGSTSTSQIAVIDSNGKNIAEKTGKTSVTGGTASKITFNYELTEGEYTIVCPSTSSSALRVIEIVASGDLIKYVEVAHTHSYTASTTKAATCVEEGVTTYKCTCGDTYTTAIARTAHNYSSDFTTDVEATYDNAGEKSRHCTQTGCDSRTDITIIEQLTKPVEEPVINTNLNGLTWCGTEWRYLKAGVVVSDYSGLVYYNGNWWYVTNGILDKSYKGVTSMNNDIWFIENGTISYKSGVWFQEGNYYWIANGKVDKNVTELKYHNGQWYYFRMGVVDWTYNTLAYANNQWWYINYGTLDKSYTGLVLFRNQLWYVTEGKLDKSYVGTTQYEGKTYNVQNGIGTIA